MDFNVYQGLALRSASPDFDRDVNGSLLNAALGLAGETGEIDDLIKKHLFQGHPLDVGKLFEEIGDLCWYMALCAYMIETKQSDIFRVSVKAAWEQFTQHTKNNLSHQPPQCEAVAHDDAGLYYHSLKLTYHMGRTVEAIYDVVCYYDLETRRADVEQNLYDMALSLQLLCKALSFPFQDVLAANIAKLKVRYPDGFSFEASLARSR